jgi:membrane-associated phospholipid phosphatase
MDATGAVLLVALLGALLAALASGSRRLHVDVLDVEAEERSFVRSLLRHPRLVRFVRQRLDRERFAGLTLTLAFVTVTATALAVGFVLDMVDRGSGLARWDDAIARWGVEHADGRTTDVLQRWTDLGAASVIIPVLVVVGLFFGLVRRRWDVVLFLASVSAGQSLINSAVKALVDRERPDIIHLTGFSGPSFPSGHSAAAAAAWSALALVLTQHAGRRVRAFAAGVVVFITLGVAASRALLGVHWLTDVVAGVALGWGWFVVCAVVFGGRRTRVGEPAERLEAAALGAAMHDAAAAGGGGRGGALPGPARPGARR